MSTTAAPVVPTAPTAFTAPAVVITPEQLRDHWQGHRRLTRRVIEAFPEDQLFAFAVGGMRPFGALALELLAMAAPLVRGVASGEWGTYDTSAEPRPRAELLAAWDEATAEIDALWPRLAERFQETANAFGAYEGRVIDLVLYTIDNEVHHRGQGYVYLRALGIAPPPFYERA